MRTLIFLFIGVILFVAIVVTNRMAARRAGEGDESSAEPDGGLGARLAEAATTFLVAAGAVPEERTVLKAALSDLASQCDALAAREEGRAALPRAARATATRLILVLYGVVERVTALAQTSASAATDALLDSAVGLIVEATDALHSIADKADESAMRHLEAELDVLRERLDAGR